MKNIYLFSLLAFVSVLGVAQNNSNNYYNNSNAGNNAENFNNAASNNAAGNNSLSNNFTSNFENTANNVVNGNSAPKNVKNNAIAPIPKNSFPANNFTNNVKSNFTNNSFGNSILNTTNTSGGVPATNIPTNNTFTTTPLTNFANSTMSSNSQPTYAQAGGVTNARSNYVTPDSEKSVVEKQIIDETRRRLEQDLEQNCNEYCRVLSLSPSVDEVFDTTSAQLGFENTVNTASNRKFNTKDVAAEVLVDERYGAQNIERLKKLFAKLQEQYPYHVSFKWTKVAFPDSGNMAKSEAQAKEEFNQNVRTGLEGIFLGYCPGECEILSVNTNVVSASMDEVRDGNASRYLFVRDGKGALYITGLDVKATINSLMTPSRKLRIQNLVREHLQAFGNVNLNMREIPFPKAALEVQKDLDDTRSDPWGLEKLGKALAIFKEHASTKEIFKESSTQASNNNSLTATEKLSSMNNKELSVNSSELSSQKDMTSSGGAMSDTTLMLIGGAILLIIFAGALGLRYVSTGKRMQEIVLEGMNGSPHHANMSTQASMPVQHNENSAPQVSAHDSFRSKLATQELKDEIMNAFSSQPKVARDLFTRVIRENGIEFAAKCVVIFGDAIVFDLLGDEELKQDLATLAEYVHVNAPMVSDEETSEILRHVKLKVTASKIRLKTQRTLDIFDFLKTKSAPQIFELIFDESPRSQGIVLTQLSAEKRRNVFDLFEGQSKVDLLRELSSGDVVPKEYLQNVAQAFKRKAMSSLKFDGENLRGSDVLLELLERLDLGAQRDLMVELDHSNADTAWLLRSRLVTIETLPFIKDGILVDIFLTLDPVQMAILLTGAREHIRNFILQKAPHDIANTWVEYMENMRSVDPESYKLAEMQVLAKLRSLAANGSINIMDVNNSIYPSANSAGEKANKNGDRTFKINNPLVA